MIRNITSRLSEVRFYDVLASGKLLNIYLKRLPQRNDDGMFQWHVGVCISNTRREANRWYTSSGGKRTAITGDGSIEGLVQAYRYLQEAMYLLDPDEEIIVGAEDKRRFRAYRYLERLHCLHSYDDQDEVVAYTLRNPLYWNIQDTNSKEAGLM